MERSPTPVATLAPVLRSSWDVFTANLLPIVVLTLAVNIPINALLELVQLPDDAGLKEWRRYFQIQRTLQFWIGTIGILGIVHLTVATSRGVQLSVRETFDRAFGNYGSALFAQFLFNLAVVPGILLGVVPGIVIAVFWFFSLQAIVVHNMPGWPALKHSYQVVKGRWWKFCGRPASLYLIMIMGIVVFSILAYFLPADLLIQIVAMIPVDLLTAFFTICFTQLYLMSEPDVTEPLNAAHEDAI